MCACVYACKYQKNFYSTLKKFSKALIAWLSSSSKQHWQVHREC